MSDNPAQTSTGMAGRFVANQQSTIGSLLRRGMQGSAANSATTPQVVNSNVVQDQVLIPTTPIDQAVDLDVLDQAIASVETHRDDLNLEDSGDSALDALVGLVDKQSLPKDPIVQENSTEDQTGLISQVMPQVIRDATDTLNPKSVSSIGGKEATKNVSLEQIAIDAARGAQQVEVEPSPEIPPEVESYLQKVEQHQETAPQEIVIADGSQTQPNDHQYPSQPVVVLPITPEIEKQGAHKNPRFSIRWLVEWSHKVMKIFSGKVVYRFEEEKK
ncbi:MAG: hypothetical protein COU63_03785 [Candidatus Pacebacteria bacterium CG10_big_fil_rev_8_21_14_0_10_36_11]|nr:hypothetical protein [Candidatus Pacearchaeota archaeon]OIP73854.1 MAG: hypothetical protein AUK08_04845 [Candidatus Pacebacteria bacterium CG2_30_36_39]PIR64583.1 MAG: hypothetical protein COU63_03785 [Candidatus Pacebacteria bacterium CG10_big_fil_rev_8_21_14_0_10_36_11]PJC43006.1 MAG: hypothetical protein CO040_01545 [Candidatus Pacebacteria bacterium CG_4_9_14_0_2_um_filter_36_8]